MLVDLFSFGVFLYLAIDLNRKSLSHNAVVKDPAMWNCVLTGLQVFERGT